MNQEGTVSYKVFFVVVFLALMYSLGSEFSEVYQCDIYVPQEGRGGWVGNASNLFSL